MFCSKCFKSVTDGEQVCRHCGSEIEQKIYRATTFKDYLQMLKGWMRSKRKLLIVITVLIIIVFVLFGFVIPIFAPYHLKNGEYRFLYCGTNVKLEKYIGSSSKVVVPKRILIFPVKEIEPACYEGCSWIDEVVIPEGIGEISENAFYDCKNLSKVTFPTDIHTISDGAFFLTNLKEVIIPESVKEIGMGAFGRCYNLENVVIPSSVEEIAGDAFNQSPWLASMTQEFVVVGKGSLLKYNGTDSVVEIPESVYYLGDYAFSRNRDIESTANIKTIIFPKTLTKIEEKSLMFESLECVVFQNDLPNVDIEWIKDAVIQSGIMVVAPKESSLYENLQLQGIQCMALEEYDAYQ